ncbi:MAG: hypothetical protein KME21_01830 [Desmonostoc vinosum HA7617-LM4]|jgi:hypothetical protein|nr:hypothetical protein [Desmonostoc vinosum HA7617-LM4]
MSQDNQNSQPPSSSEPQRNRPKSNTQKPYQRVQPIWKTKVIQILRGTIGVLETTVVKLETESLPGAAETPGLWGGFLAKVRSFLPANFSAKLSNTALTGIIAGVAVILVWTSATVVTKKPTEVVTLPPVEEVSTPTPTITTPPEAAPIEPEPQVSQPPPEVTPTPTPEPTPTPTPTPALELTPEETLIAAIENQVAEISDRITSGLIKSIQANFRTGNLTIKISDDWYTLKDSQQNKLATEILQRSQELDFTHLEIIDSQDNLIARNPVVGSEIIIFQRREIINLES